MPRIICTVTNDISYDQRMQRICGSLANAGYEVCLVGRLLPQSLPLPSFNFATQRVKCWFNRGFAFYAEFNIRLLWLLLGSKADAFYAVDVDTIVPHLLASKWKKKPRLYDAHELFTEQKEIVTRPWVHRCWLAIERWTVPQFGQGYTVNMFIQQELQRRYGVHYGIVRNIPVLKAYTVTASATNTCIIYQGAVNEGRSFETLIPAMQEVDAPLLICGEGNFFAATKALIHQYGVAEKVQLKGYVAPKDLQALTPTCRFGLTLFEATGLNQYYSLANRFFDYMMAGIPQICVGYPEYKAINEVYEIALLVEDTEPTTLARAMNQLLHDDVTYNRLKENCLKARAILNWQAESQHLLHYWQQILPLHKA